MEAADLIIDTVNAQALNFHCIAGPMALSPLDLQERFGLVEGDIFHGALALDRLIDGDVTGLPGYNGV
jgi:phytoene dehydrogenase-like protein